MPPSNKPSRPLIVRALSRCFRLLGLNHAVFRIAAGCAKVSRPKALTVDEAETLLQRVSPDYGRSALHENRLHRPAYDVQIVIPAYNAAETLEECLDSVLAQKTRFSVLTIVVDDGSTDCTPRLLARYAGRHDLRLIRQENKGFSGARNAGLRDIHARYVCFVDADDRLSPDAIERLVSAADKAGADIAEGGFRTFADGETLGAEQPAPYEGADWTLLQGYPWGKVYKAELFAHVCFPENYWFEDTVGVLLVYPQARRIVRLPQTVYDYRHSPQGITQTSRGKVRSIDSLWVSRRLLHDASAFGIQMGPAYFEAWLHDTRNTLVHFAFLRNEACLRASLVLLRHLRQTFFPRLQAALPSHRTLLRVLDLCSPRLLRLYLRLF